MVTVAYRNTLCHTVSTRRGYDIEDKNTRKSRTEPSADHRGGDRAVRERSYAELNVGEIMERAGIGRTIFYRHFDDLGDLLVRAGREAIDELLTAQLALAETRVATGPADIRRAIELPVRVYSRHGPLLRAVAEAAAADPGLTPAQAAIRQRFDELVADALHRSMPGRAGSPTSWRRPTPSTCSTRATCSTPSAANRASRPRPRRHHPHRDLGGRPGGRR